MNTESILETIFLNKVPVIRIKSNFYTSRSMAKSLTETLNKMIEEQQNSVIINMNEVTSLDSEGIGTLIYGYKKFVEASGMFVICELNDQYVREVIEIVNLNKIIDIVGTEEEALSRICKNNQY